jgi:hypothetical protein
MHVDPTPRERIEAECRRRGRSALVAGCARLIMDDDVDVGLILVLGGATARAVLSKGPRDDLRYWFRVWGARGLLWAWDGTALEAVRHALRDEAWRVRELGAKIVARHLIGDALTDVAGLREDPVPRVRAAATRAVVRLTRAGA